jgi:hypothetical protein
MRFSMIVAHIHTRFADAFFPRLSEWFAAFVLFGLGLMLLANDDLMVTGATRGYHLMLEIAPQQTWATVLVTFGTVRLMVLLINGAWRRSPHARAGFAFLSCFFWTQIMLSFAPTFGFSFVMSCGWLVADMINVMRAMRDARTSDDAFARDGASGTK